MELMENNNKDNIERIEKQNQVVKDEEKKTFIRIKEMQKLIKKKSEMANHCM